MANSFEFGSHADTDVDVGTLVYLESYFDS